MKVTLKFNSPLSEMAGCREINMEVPKNARVRQLIEAWWQQLGGRIQQRALQYRWHLTLDQILIVINNEMIPQSGISEVILKEDDIINLVPVIPGG